MGMRWRSHLPIRSFTGWTLTATGSSNRARARCGLMWKKMASTGTNGSTTRWRRVRDPAGRCPCLRLQETDRESLYEFCRGTARRAPTDPVRAESTMAKLDQRTLTNQPDPPDCGKTIPKRVRTQIHRRTKPPDPRPGHWELGSGQPPGDLRPPRGKMPSRAVVKNPEGPSSWNSIVLLVPCFVDKR